MVVAVYHDGVIAVGDSYREVFAAAAEQGIAKPLTLRVPTAEEATAVFPPCFPLAANERPRPLPLQATGRPLVADGDAGTVPQRRVAPDRLLCGFGCRREFNRAKRSLSPM